MIGVYLSSNYNSTMFTNCCNVAICNDEKKCPKCKKDVIGCNEKTDHERGLTRWFYAYKR